MRTKISIIITIVVLLLIPLIAMQFSNAINWGVLDFIIAATLLFGTGLFINLVKQKVSSKRLQVVIIVFILLALLLIWAELAVGVF